MGNDVGCDELLDGEGESCIRTSKHTDHDTCKEHGLDMVVPKSREHWKLLLSKYDKSYFATIPGIYKPTNGGDFRKVAMNSDAMPAGGYRAIDGGDWWLRDTPYGEPNGNYHANCWLKARDVSNPDDLKFDDHDCRYHTDKYVGAVPKAVPTTTTTNKTVVTVFNNLVCPRFFNTSSARFEVFVEGGTTVTVRRLDAPGWHEFLNLPCTGSTGDRTGKGEMACLSTYFHQPAMMTLTGAFNINPVEERSEVDTRDAAIIEYGNNFNSRRTEDPDQSAKAKCRCVSPDNSRAISICNSGCGDPNRICWEGVGCSSSDECNKDTCTCKPKDVNGNTMAFAECRKQCAQWGCKSR